VNASLASSRPVIVPIRVKEKLGRYYTSICLMAGSSFLKEIPNDKINTPDKRIVSSPYNFKKISKHCGDFLKNEMARNDDATRVTSATKK